jgi:DNA (cytosine-5)-methyltransferase 1
MDAYYNENDPKAAAWLRSLIDAGLIAGGTVDERSIHDVRPEDLDGVARVHLFAGIGGWDYALRLAGWSADEQVWTGSCPCQPFSSAGKRLGEKDPRDLWPVFMRLISECRPPIVFGEQVASSEVVGTQQEASFLIAVQNGDYARANKLAKRLAKRGSFHYWARWVDRVQADLAKEGYAFRFEVLGAHSVGAPHIRQRLFWVAVSDGRDASEGGQKRSWKHRQQSEDGRTRIRVANPEHKRAGAGEQGIEGQARRGRDRPTIDSQVGGLENATGGREVPTKQPGQRASPKPPGLGVWSGYEWIACADGKARRIESGLEPLVDGVPGRVAQLRGLGNAIVPQVAAEFVRAFVETRSKE